MGRHIQDPKTIFSEVTDDFKAIFRDDLVSIILYGSAAGQDFQPGLSNINFMVVLTENGIEHIDQAFGVVTKWRRRGVALPLFLTEAYVRRSLDVFPIEYLGFQRHHVLVFGKEILKDLEFKAEFIRLQCEREVKGKLLLLREAFMESSGKPKALKAILKEAFPALIAIFEALLHLRGDAIPPTRRKIIRAAAGSFDIKAGVFEVVLDIRRGSSRLRDGEVVPLFKDFLNEIQRLSNRIDSFT
jgi:hypothetical protein